jgi:hypothetical protein
VPALLREWAEGVKRINSVGVFSDGERRVSLSLSTDLSTDLSTPVNWPSARPTPVSTSFSPAAAHENAVTMTIASKMGPLMVNLRARCCLDALPAQQR